MECSKEFIIPGHYPVIEGNFVMLEAVSDGLEVKDLKCNTFHHHIIIHGNPKHNRKYTIEHIMDVLLMLVVVGPRLDMNGGSSLNIVIS